MRRLPITRQSWVVLHRWAGLTIALFLIVVGVTGAILPFNEELTFASRPGLSSVKPPRAGAVPLDAISLAERVQRQTGGLVSSLSFDVPGDHVARLAVGARAGRPPFGFDEVWADPYTGAIRLRHRYGVLADGPQNIVPFLYRVHENLALGDWGRFALGIAALIWTIDCFVGFYLTLPPRWRGVAATRPRSMRWWSRWRPAWSIRTRASGYKLNFDLHRAGGLWLWPLLLIFAWSSVGFNLPAVHEPVMRAFGALPSYDRKALPAPLNEPPLDMRAATATGARLMAARAHAQGFTVEHASYLAYYPGLGVYRYIARTSLDIMDEGGLTTVWVDARSGRDAGFEQSTGETTASTVMEWMYMLHMAQVFGLPYRIFVSALGLAVVGLSVTGVVIWMKKRSARLLSRRRIVS